MSKLTEEFIASYTSCQSQLFAFLLSILGSPHQAEEVLQEANLVIWRKSEQFQPGTSFIAWAITIARYQAMAYREKQGREYLVFNDQVTEAIAEAYTQHDRWTSDRLSKLDHCFGQLPQAAQELLTLRYREGLNPAGIAEKQGKTYRAIVQSLSRIRSMLADCIRQKEASHG
jgi:RNA polymerase sigma-70 factor (ECF subfamily)